MAYTCPFISKFSIPFTKTLGIVPSAQITITITVTFMFNCFFLQVFILSYFSCLFRNQKKISSLKLPNCVWLSLVKKNRFFLDRLENTTSWSTKKYYLLIDLKILPHVFQFWKPVKREIVTQVIKWVGFFCDHLFDCSFLTLSYCYLFIWSLSLRLCQLSLTYLQCYNRIFCLFITPNTFHLSKLPSWIILMNFSLVFFHAIPLACLHL